MITKADSTIPVNTLTLADSAYAAVFEGILPAVKTLYVRSDNLPDLLTRPRVAIVGSRKVSPYGRAVTAQFAGDLARQGIVIVSGLAYGVDAIAHQAALDAGGLTIAVLPSSVEKVYPAAHTELARRIVGQGGALMSEYPAAASIAYKNQFIERNRIVSGMSNVLLITEAAINSGTMHTARFALEQGKDVLAIPGNITSATSAGTNNLIKAGAAPATSPEDVLALLGLKPLHVAAKSIGGTAHEQLILDLLSSDISDGDQLLAGTALPIDQFNHALTMLELTGKVRALGANKWSLN
ncbi:MAG TPA: DNA-processing protein DprA [Candidatus Saccharimonadales bacterium]|jgi:DNA processing protein